MALSARVRTENRRDNFIWRFYSDAAHHWRWQRLAFDGTVIEHSKSGYSQYEACVADAGEHGYVPAPSLSTQAASGLPKITRSYIRLTAKHQKLVSEIEPEAVEPETDLPADPALDSD